MEKTTRAVSKSFQFSLKSAELSVDFSIHIEQGLLRSGGEIGPNWPKVMTCTVALKKGRQEEVPIIMTHQPDDGIRLQPYRLDQIVTEADQSPA